MKKLLILFFFSVLSVNLFSQNADNITDLTSVSSSDILNKKAFFKDGLFGSDSILKVTLKFDITEFLKNKSKGEYQDAVIIIHGKHINDISRNIKIKARGNFRRSNCVFPPIHLNFEKDSTGLGETFNKLKLVCHCMNPQKYENYVLREYLAYKLYNELSEYSFKVRLLDSLCKKTLQNYKCFFWRYFHFSQFIDAQASFHFKKVKISSKIIHFIKFDSFLAETRYNL